MGMDIQDKSFWRLTPNNFICMYMGFKKRQQTEMYMVRKLIHYLAASVGTVVDERLIHPLPLIDARIKVAKKEVYVPPTEEEILGIEEEHRRLMFEIEKRNLNKRD